MPSRFIHVLKLFLFFALLQTGCNRQSSFEKNKISKSQKLNIGTFRGIESPTRIIYYVEKGEQLLTAYDNEKIKWQVNIIESCAIPAIGEPKIRFIELASDQVFLVFGKHSVASVNISTGKVICLGAD